MLMTSVCADRSCHKIQLTCGTDSKQKHSVPDILGIIYTQKIGYQSDLLADGDSKLKVRSRQDTAATCCDVAAVDIYCEAVSLSRSPCLDLKRMTINIC